jgi:hypothetical protein
MPETGLVVQPVVKAAVLLAARTLSGQLGLPQQPSVAQILAATGASKSRAYEVRGALMKALETLIRPCGRPAAQTAPQPQSNPADAAITAAVLAHVLRNPGCAQANATRQRYSEDFRHFIVKVREQHSALSLEDFADRVQVPLGTLKPWLAHPHVRNEPSGADGAANPEQSLCQSDGRGPEVTMAQIQAVLTAWGSWRGTFGAFTNHVRQHLRLAMRRQTIAHILEAHGVRRPRRRSGRSRDELALRGAFDTFFPGAQWIGDGKTVSVVVNGEKHDLNLELNVDAHTGAFVGLCVRDEEDSSAVIQAFEEGIATTGSVPIAELLDNKPCNHTPDVDATMHDAGTLLIRATSGRPQNKAHVEGAFGLFAQQTPAIEIDTKTNGKGIAHALLLLVATTFARAINHRPRVDRGGKSRIELYAEQPTDEQIQAAKSALQQRWRKQELARATREQRQRPQVRELVDHHFECLGLQDPKRHIRLAIGAHPLDAIVDGIAIFAAKQRAGTLPDSADGRYLLGIVRNVAAQREGDAIAQTLWGHRTYARDRAVKMLERQREAICQSAQTAEEAVLDCAAAAMDADNKLDRLFWLTAAIDHARSHPEATHHALYATAARYINNTFRIPPLQRQQAIRFLADRMIPIN